MEKSKKYLYIILPIIIVLAGGSIVSFLIATDYNKFFWTSYISFIVSILYFTFSSIYFIKNNKEETPVRLSLITCGILYVLITWLLIILGHTLSLNFRLYLALHIVNLGIFLVLLISIIGFNESIIMQESHVVNNKLNINTLCIEIGKLINNASSMPDEVGKEIIPILNTLQDKVRYMDPMSNESVASYDIKIRDGIKDIENILLSHEASSDLVTKIKEQVKQLTDTISVRNDTLKASK